MQSKDRDIERFHLIDGRKTVSDQLAVESHMRIVLNDQPLIRMAYLPGMEKELAMGFLRTNGWISAAADVMDWQWIPERRTGFIRSRSEAAVNRVDSLTLGSGCSATGTVMAVDFLEPISTKAQVSPESVLRAVKELHSGSDLFNTTGAVHSVSLCNLAGDALIMADDVGRHCAFDKIVGAAMLDDSIDIANSMTVCTGRLSSDIAVKAWRIGLPILVSRSSPTLRAVELAEEADMTLIGFARGKRLNVYAGGHRLKSED